MVSKTITLIVRAIQVIMSAIIMALAGHMISTSGWNQIPRKGGNAAEVNYAMFVCVFALISMPLFVTAALKERGRVISEILYATFAVDVLNLLFFLCGGIALAAAMGVHSCNNKKYTTTNRITNSSPDTRSRCHEAQAVTAFLWFTFLAFNASAALSAVASTSNARHRGEEPPSPAEMAAGGPPVADETYHDTTERQGPGIKRGEPPIPGNLNDYKNYATSPTGGPPVAGWN
ncbi:MAG: hypothetical protein M1813_000384 [Trichoglossum hirsutum]|nr:MAG: hypothetical protein M1813_000384 [Trichoglossum hirsutum]